MQVAPSGGQICNQFKWWHNRMGNGNGCKLKFNMGKKIIQVKDSIPWVRCASGNVFLLCLFWDKNKIAGLLLTSNHTFSGPHSHCDTFCDWISLKWHSCHWAQVRWSQNQSPTNWTFSTFLAWLLAQIWEGRSDWSGRQCWPPNILSGNPLLLMSSTDYFSFRSSKLSFSRRCQGCFLS